jgi:hypothetical protein
MAEYVSLKRLIEELRKTPFYDGRDLDAVNAVIDRAEVVDAVPREDLLKRIFPLGVPATKDMNYGINAVAVYMAVMKE